MDFQELLSKRRSIRDFQDRAVPLQVVTDIIRDSCLAPTASNRQPCRFVIIHDREEIKKLSHVSKQSLLSALAKNPASPLQTYEAVLRDDSYNVFYNAPCLVFIAGPKDLDSLDLDCALTASYFMLAATARGLGTCWVGLGSHIRDAGILQEMGLPKGNRIVAPLILGYPTVIPPPRERHEPIIASIL